jgi:hypothetical protein
MAIPVFKNSDQYSTLNVNKSDIRIETVSDICMGGRTFVVVFL